MNNSSKFRVAFIASIIAWIIAATVGGSAFSKISEVAELDQAAFLPNSAESTQVNQALGNFQDGSSIPAIVVFESEGDITDADQEKITSIRADVAEADAEFITGDLSPVTVSEDNKAVLFAVPIDAEASITEAVERLTSVVKENESQQLTSYVTGPAGFSADISTAFEGIDGLLLVVALSVVFVILIVVYRSVLLPIFVLMTSLFALTVSVATVYYLGMNGIVTLNGQVQGILFILVIGAATDYSLLLVSRYREELLQTKDSIEALKKSVIGSIEPILASGGTVIVGLLFLLLSDLESNKALGPVGSIGIAFAMLSALTFLPAVLGLFGRTIFWPSVPRATLASKGKRKLTKKPGLWQRIGAIVGTYPRRIWVITTVLLAILAMFALSFRSDGISQTDLVVGETDAKRGQDTLSEHFPGGSGTPAYVLVPTESVESVVSIIDETDGVDGVAATATGVDAEIKPLGEAEDKIRSEIKAEVESELKSQRAEISEQADQIRAQAGAAAARQFEDQATSQIPDVDVLVEQAYPFTEAEIRESDGSALLQVTLSDNPDSDSAKGTVRELRQNLANTNALVGGQTAIQIDTIDASLRDRAVIIPSVLVAITLILMVLLRSVITAILLIMTTILSFGSTLGVAALLFNNVFNFPGADPSVVLYGFVFLVALGIDYNIFLMTRVREEVLKKGNAEGVIKGLVVTGGVITSAGIVLAATFAALGVIPIVFLYQLAFIVAFGVLLDTFIVRSLLVPALVKDVGPIVWWPSSVKK